jgi:hypothetical protein
MLQLIAPLCLSLAGMAGAGQEISTHTLRAAVSFAPRTSLTTSTSTLRFVVTDPGKPAYTTVNFSAAARTIANGELTLVMQIGGDAARDVVLSISGGSDGVLVGGRPDSNGLAAARWSGSGLREGHVTFALSAAPGVYDLPVTFLLKLS